MTENVLKDQCVFKDVSGVFKGRLSEKVIGFQRFLQRSEGSLVL